VSDPDYFYCCCPLLSDGERGFLAFAADISPRFTRMLAVMTMNAGYFLSVVIGTFAGSVLLGGHTVAAGH
jgi:hypothetical protein